MIFASEHLILQRFLEDRRLSKHVRKLRPRGVGASGAWIVDLRARRARDFDWSSPPDLPFVPGHVLAIDDVTPDKLRENNSGIAARPVVSSVQLSRYEIDEAPIKQLRRCSHCVLPETVPFISFDERGVCNFCRDYKSASVQGRSCARGRAAVTKRNEADRMC